MKKSFKESLNLPRTEFSIRANAATKEPEMLKRWDSDQIDKKAQDLNKGMKNFVFHDGPPYANGNIHIGTAFNKIAKDIACKSKRMAGKHVYFKPGWDCHGLPIELKVLDGKKAEKLSTSDQRIAFKKECRKFAQKWIEIQKGQFKQLGILASWNDYYNTMNPKYEASIVRAFATFVRYDYIERKGKTVPWCLSCQTVLAQAEIEYKDRKDPSIYVKFPLNQPTAQKVFADLLKKKPQLSINLLVWTTTPWTIPLNRAVLLKPKSNYVLVQDKITNESFIVAKSLAEKVCKMAEIPCIILDEFDSSALENGSALHPLLPQQKTLILLENTVLLEDGTACVHSAPGCGPDDYLIGIKNNLEIFSPLSADGKYTEGIKPQELENKSVSDGQGWVIKKLIENEKLFHKESIRHSYPHCWRCRNGLIFRATDQWFCNLQKNNLVEDTLAEVRKINFVPDWGKTRLSSSIANRTEWCISRQRQWGTPIIALLCDECETPYLSADFINKIADGIEKEGIEYWDKVTVEDLQQYGILRKKLTSKKSKRTKLKK